MRPFRFGLQIGGGSAEELVARARAAEASGFDVLHTSDHVGEDWAPLTTLATLGAATESIRLCPLVLNNDFRHPVQLAREFVALDHLTNGRMEMGIGAGHSFTEYEAIGLRFDPPSVRKARMAESVEILRRLFDGEVVTVAGEHYQLEGVRIQRARQAHLPIFVGVNGTTALAHAARHADTIGLTMLGPALADGQTHETRWAADRLDATIAYLRDQNAQCGRDPELHALVQAVVVAENREAVAAKFVERGVVPTVGDALATPFLAIGTHDDIAEHLVQCRERWGITYYSVRDLEALAPVIAQLS